MWSLRRKPCRLNNIHIRKLKKMNMERSTKEEEDMEEEVEGEELVDGSTGHTGLAEAEDIIHVAAMALYFLLIICG